MARLEDFLLPDLGEGLTEAQIVDWLIEPGDTVEVDQPVAEVETAKAVVEVTCPFDGTVTTLHASVGDEVAVGQPLITIDVGAADGAGTQAVGTAPNDAEVGEMVPQPSAPSEQGGADGDSDSGTVLVGYGTGRSRTRRRRGGGAPPAGAPPGATRHESARSTPTARDGRPLAKPPVRKLAKDLGVDLADVPGSGPDGIITRDDVEAHAAGAGPAAPAAPTAPEPAAAAVAPPEAPTTDPVQRVPVRGIRKRIAERMTVSRREIPEATAWVDVDATTLMDLRDDLNAEQSDVRVSPLALIARVVVAGLRAYPQLNARLDTEREEIVLQRFVHLGVAAQTDRGLLVPVIANAHERSTLSIAGELNRLAAAARDGSVRPDELTGGTFTLSNYGSFGIDGGSAVINHPEVAILGVGRIVEKPWVVDGGLAVRRVLQLSLAFDHRVCDGGDAGGFLRFVGDCIESPARLLAAL